MPQTIVVLEAAPLDARPAGYTLTLGPLAFVSPLAPLGETLGEGLEAVGAALVPAERRPRPVKLKLAIRAYHRDPNPTATGLRLRRQVRQLLDNAPFRMQALYLSWEADPDLDGWLLVGGGDVTETDPGVGFGEFELELNDVYTVGRPGTHRPGRRLDLADRRTGLAPRDTRGLIYSIDYATHPLLTEPLVIPGDVSGIVGAQNRATTIVTGHTRGSRVFYRNAAAVNGEAVSYLADPAVLPVRRTANAEVNRVGAVRCFDLTPALVNPPVPSGYGRLRDDSPDVYYGWEQVYGDPLSAEAPLVLENGLARVVWLGRQASQGLAIEWYDADLGAFRRDLRVLAGANAGEAQVVELTPERGVLEFRGGDRALRVILQRGWWGPRLEGYADTPGQTAALELAQADGGTIASNPSSPTWVDSLLATSPVVARNYMPNPSAEVNATGYTAVSATLTRVTTTPAVGAAALQVVTSGAVVGQGASQDGVPLPEVLGQQILAEVRVRPTASVTLQLTFHDGVSASVMGPVVTCPANVYTTLTVLANVAANATLLRLSCLTAGTAQARTFLLDAWRATLTPDPGYFDGSSTPRAGWEGTAHASRSVLRDRVPAAILAARATADTTQDTSPVYVSGAAVCYRRLRAVALQISAPPGPTSAGVASLSLADARAEPVLLARGR